MKLAEITENGSDLEILKALRQKIADAIDQSNSGRDIASLSRQLQIVLEQISVLEKGGKDEIDELLATCGEIDIGKNERERM